MSISSSSSVILIACTVLREMLDDLNSNHLFDQSLYFDFGLHTNPDALRAQLQEAIDGLETPSLVVLGYGLCGNGTRGLKAGPHTLLMPRAHDCIPIIFGSRQAYEQQRKAEVGTYYLSKGWLEASENRIEQPGAINSQYGADPLTQYQLYVNKYGEDMADWVMKKQFEHYTRLALVGHNQEELEKYRPRAKEIACYCQSLGMRYEEILGSDRYIRRLIEVVDRFSKNGELPDEDEFLVIPPQSEICQDQF